MSNSDVDITEIDWLKVSEFASVSELSETHTADSDTCEFTLKHNCLQRDCLQNQH